MFSTFSTIVRALQEGALDPDVEANSEVCVETIMGNLLHRALRPAPRARLPAADVCAREAGLWSFSHSSFAPPCTTCRARMTISLLMSSKQQTGARFPPDTPRCLRTAKLQPLARRLQA